MNKKAITAIENKKLLADELTLGEAKRLNLK